VRNFTLPLLRNLRLPLTHRLRYDFQGEKTIYVVVPKSTVEESRFTIIGSSYASGSDPGQIYTIDDQEITSCGPQSMGKYCEVPQADITDKLMEGTHKIFCDEIHDSEKITMIIEIITSSKPERPFILHGPDFNPWINET
jgi:hypothetical protein